MADHLLANPGVLVAVWRMGQEVSRRGMGEIAGKDLARLHPFPLGGFHDREHWPESHGRVGSEAAAELIHAAVGVGGYVTVAGTVSGGVGAAGRSRIPDRAVGTIGTYQSSDLRVQVQGHPLVHPSAEG